MPSSEDLSTWLGNIDIHLLDQVLRGRIRPGMKLLDAGCGSGRNLVWFLRQGYSVTAVDSSPDAVVRVRELAASLAPHLPDRNFQVQDLRALELPDRLFDVVICNAVLHFAEDEASFQAMVRELWRVLAPGGLLFCRLASRQGMEDKVIPTGGERRYLLPDESYRFLVDDEYLMQTTAALEGALVDPIKTTHVQGLRCMATWILTRPEAA